MKKFKIRFNTECPNKGEPNALCWRAVINEEEFLTTDIEINVPTKTTCHTLEDGIKKWSISCESDNYYFDENKKLIINEAGKYNPSVIWMTGLSGAGKTTIANAIHERLKMQGQKSIILDGDEIRNFFKMGFDKQSRIEHNLNVGRMASVFEKQGFIVIVSLISPYKEARDEVRKISKNFFEVYVNTPLEVCEKRDVKGLYAKARKGEIKQFTGIDDVYEIPENPEMVIDTTNSLDDCVENILHNFKIININLQLQTS